EAASICVSSLIIMILPIFSILALGSALFGIAILPNFPAVFLIITLLSANFILLGMATAYMIKKESITLLVSTFMLVFFVFFSGVLVPIERMNAYFAFAAGNLPLNTALEAFNKAVFYGKDVFSLGSETALLLGWLAVSAAVALGAKRFRRS
ncbi:MAG TPA: ABC transporter permease, partial [archaeon]|nr:ABC transporter permease [archaeon]